MTKELTLEQKTIIKNSAEWHLKLAEASNCACKKADEYKYAAKAYETLGMKRGIK